MRTLDPGSTDIAVILFAAEFLHLLRLLPCAQFVLNIALLRVYSVTGYEGDAVGYHHPLEVSS
jgi:hypothetical protein